jgi:hypothetical protein
MANKCQGLPDGPCPANSCHASVKYTIDDLFLCRTCENARELSFADAAKASGDVTILQLGQKGKQPKSNSDSAIVTGDPLLPPCQSSLKLTTRRHTTRTNSVSWGEDGDGVACPRCLMLANGKRVLKCDICHEAYHQRCTDMAAKTFD